MIGLLFHVSFDAILSYTFDCLVMLKSGPIMVGRELWLETLMEFVVWLLYGDIPALAPEDKSLLCCCSNSLPTTVPSWYLAVSFLQRTQKRDPIPHRGCLFIVYSLNKILRYIFWIHIPWGQPWLSALISLMCDSLSAVFDQSARTLPIHFCPPN